MKRRRTQAEMAAQRLRRQADILENVATPGKQTLDFSVCRGGRHAVAPYACGSEFRKSMLQKYGQRRDKPVEENLSFICLLEEN